MNPLDYDYLADRLQANAHNEDALPLRNEACRSRFFLHPHPTATVFLFLHGFTAGPYQFEPIGRAFHTAGANVLVPLQPGHGRAGDWNRHMPPPLPTDIRVYQDFVLHWLDIAQQLGQRVIVGGLSSGGTLAAWVALHHAQRIDRALLFAPFLGSRAKPMDWLMRLLPFYFEWFNKDASGSFGYPGFRIPALRIFLDLAHQVLAAAPTRPTAPLLIVCSEADQAASLSRPQTLFRSILTHQHQSWYYCFDKSLDIGHRMMTDLEDNDHEELVITLAKAYVESDLTWAQLNAIAHHLRHGEDYDTITQAMHLRDRISPCLKPILLHTLALDGLDALRV